MSLLIRNLIRKEILSKSISQFNCLKNNYSFKSPFALESLYPNCNARLYTPTFKPEDPKAPFTGYIPLDQLTITYSHSSGPGGQHVNTSNTKVDLRFNVKDAKWFPEEAKQQFMLQERNKINKDGCFIIKSELTRFRHLNLADALEKLRTMIRKALKDSTVRPVPPETEERIRKGQIKAARQRLFEKRMRSQIKETRNSSVDI